jgi:hypothetical protein
MAGIEIDWPLVIVAILVAVPYLGAGYFAQTPSGRTMSTSA